MKTESFFTGCFTKNVKTSEDNLSDKTQMDERAFLIMECIESRVSPTLFNMLCKKRHGGGMEILRKMATNIINCAVSIERTSA